MLQSHAAIKTKQNNSKRSRNGGCSHSPNSSSLPQILQSHKPAKSLSLSFNQPTSPISDASPQSPHRQTPKTPPSLPPATAPTPASNRHAHTSYTLVPPKPYQSPMQTDGSARPISDPRPRASTNIGCRMNVANRRVWRLGFHGRGSGCIFWWERV